MFACGRAVFIFIKLCYGRIVGRQLATKFQTEWGRGCACRWNTFLTRVPSQRRRVLGWKGAERPAIAPESGTKIAPVPTEKSLTYPPRGPPTYCAL